MKKVLFLSLIFFLGLALAGFIPVKADNIVYNPSVPTITPAITVADAYKNDTALYVTELLRQGGMIDFSNVATDYNINNFVDDFIDNLDYLLAGQKRWSSINDLAVTNTYNLTSLGIDGLINIYRNKLSEIPSDITPTPTPQAPPNLVPYIQKMNSNNGSGSDFFWSDYPNFTDLNGSISGYTNLTYPWTSYSYINTTLSYPIVRSSFNSSPLAVCPLTDIFIYSTSNNNFSFSTVFHSTVIGIMPSSFNFGSNYGYLIRCAFQKTQEQKKINWQEYQNYNSIDEHSQSYTLSYQNHSLEDCFAYLSNHVRNVNVYVDNVLYAYVGNNTYFVNIGDGTFLEGSNTPVEYQYPVDIYIDIDDLIDRISNIINNKDVLTFDDIQDLILDVNGQQAVAVTIVQDDMAIDDILIKDYGSLIPLFPVFVSWDINPNTISNVATIGIVDVIPDDLIQVFAIAFMGMLFVTMIHRLIE